MIADSCGGTIIGASGLIQSPQYPNNYPNRAECEWYIQGPIGHFLHVNFTQFQLSNSVQPENCTGQDSLSFYNRDRFGKYSNWKKGKTMFLSKSAYAWLTEREFLCLAAS